MSKIKYLAYSCEFWGIGMDCFNTSRAHNVFQTLPALKIAAKRPRGPVATAGP